MSVPKSKVLSSVRSLSVGKGVLGLADVKCQSPSQSQIINLTVHNDKKTEEKTTGGTTIEAEEVKGEVVANYPSTYEENPYSKLDQDGTYSAESRIAELQNMINDKGQVIEALSLIIELLESNPLIINRYVIAKADTLERLVLLLTGADNVEILVTDVECGCNTSRAVNPIERIYVTKNDKILQLKYDFPESMRILETHRISTKLTY